MKLMKLNDDNTIGMFLILYTRLHVLLYLCSALLGIFIGKSGGVVMQLIQKDIMLVLHV